MSVAEQLDVLRHRAATAGRVVTTVRPVNLHPPTQSFLVLTKPARPFDPEQGRPPSSDEAGVYDVVDGHVRRKFAFRPRPRRTGGLEGTLFIDTFSLLASGDLDRDGSGEVVGVWESHDIDGGGIDEPFDSLKRPIAITWDDRRLAYKQTPLLQSASVGTNFGERDADTRRRIRAYLTRVAITSDRIPARGAPIRSYGAEAVALDRRPRDSPLLLAGLIVKGAGRIIEFDRSTGGMRVRFPRTGIIDVKSLDFQSGEVTLGACTLSQLNLLGPVFRTRAPFGPALLSRVWRRFRRVADC